MTAPVGELLRERNWPALADFFRASEPQSAQEFEARALLALQDRSAPIDWAPLVADLQRACALAPGDARLRSNLAQALLDAGRPVEASEQARLAHEHDPGLPPVLERLALTEAAMQRWDASLAALLRLKGANGTQGRISPAAERLLGQLGTGWWRPIAAANVTLRQPSHEHAGFLGQAFAQAEFMRHFHRFQPQGAQAVRQFIDTAGQPPWRSRRVDWMVHDAAGDCIGLAALVEIDWVNQRGELLVGFPRPAGPSTALQVSVAALEFAFARLRLAKVVSYVYADNPLAQHNSLHLGFTQEGLLRSHVRAESGRLDLFVNGLLREDYEINPLLMRLRRRWIGERDAVATVE